jgi:hypothetical protein
MARSMRSRRPAPGQLWFVFLGDVPASEVVVPNPVVEPVEVLPAPVVEVVVPPPAAPRPPRTADRAVPAWRRARTPRTYTEEKKERTTARWIARGATCILCATWPAPVEHEIDNRLVVTCRACAAQPNARARMAEIVNEDWRQRA